MGAPLPAVDLHSDEAEGKESQGDGVRVGIVWRSIDCLIVFRFVTCILARLLGRFMFDCLAQATLYGPFSFDGLVHATLLVRSMRNCLIVFILF